MKGQARFQPALQHLLLGSGGAYEHCVNATVALWSGQRGKRCAHPAGNGRGPLRGQQGFILETRSTDGPSCVLSHICTSVNSLFIFLAFSQEGVSRPLSVTLLC